MDGPPVERAKHLFAGAAVPEKALLPSPRTVCVCSALDGTCRLLFEPLLRLNPGRSIGATDGVLVRGSDSPGGRRLSIFARAFCLFLLCCAAPTCWPCRCILILALVYILPRLRRRSDLPLVFTFAHSRPPENLLLALRLLGFGICTGNIARLLRSLAASRHPTTPLASTTSD